MKPITLIAVPLLLMTQSVNLIVNLKNGETTTIDTENIETFTFEESEPVTPPGVDPVTPPEDERDQLQTPEVTVTEVGNGSAIAKWAAIDGAVFYKHQLDDQAPITERLLQITLTKMDAGQHTLKVIAVPADKESYIDSEPAVVTFTIENGYDNSSCS